MAERVQGLPNLKSTLLPVQPGDIFEFDETWSFVLQKINKCWLWPVLCRRPRQIIAFMIGDRSEKSCCRLWTKFQLNINVILLSLPSGKPISRSYRKPYTQLSIKRWTNCPHGALVLYLAPTLIRYVRKTLFFFEVRSSLQYGNQMVHH